MPLNGTQLTHRAVAKLVWDAGWRDEKVIIAVAIVNAESSRYTEAEGPPNPDGSIDRGLHQINSFWIGKAGPDGQPITLAQLWDPASNTAIAYMIYKRAGYKFTPWSAFNSKRHEDFLAEGVSGFANMFRERYGLPIR